MVTLAWLSRMIVPKSSIMAPEASMCMTDDFIAKNVLKVKTISKIGDAAINIDMILGLLLNHNLMHYVDLRCANCG